MKIHEYQAKQLLKDAGVAIPAGLVAESGKKAAQCYDQLGSDVAVVKAQVHAGGRGKGGGIKLVRSADEAADVAQRMLDNPLVTPQTGPEGRTVHRVLVEEGCKIARELYLGVVVDRAAGKPVVIASAEGGVEIEEVAAKSPEKIHRVAIDADAGVHSFQARKLATALQLDGKPARQFDFFLRGLCRVFIDKDCSLAEINPLVVTEGEQLLALDAKMNFDDNALYRHPELTDFRDPDEEEPTETRAAQHGLSYVKLDGTIGCLVNGAGLAMSTMDLIKLHGGEPANFLDVGGGAKTNQVIEAFRILLADKNVKAVLVNIFGGIMQCTTIARALLEAYKTVGFNVPLVVRLEGTEVKEGRQILADSGVDIISAEDLTDAARKVVAAAG
jgi:succinyl-CoA synthetase beta subunit